MQLKNPKNTDKYFWTTHSIYKMRQYGLSEQKIRSVIRSPFRKEEGIVKNTVAVMQPNKKEKHTSEIWAMYQLKKTKTKNQIPNNFQNSIPSTRDKIQNFANQQIRIISAWRYPGISPERNPIPEEILREVAELEN